MTVHYTHIGYNEDGTPRFHVESDVAGAHLVLTGPIVGPVMVDGVAIDVSAPVIEAESPAHALAISDAIGARHVAEGHSDFVNDPDADSFWFVHIPSTEA